MRVWPALVLSPLVALASIALGYALVEPACHRGLLWVLNAAILGSLALSAGATALAWNEKDDFLRHLALGCGAFFSVVIVAQWSAQFFVTPCMR